MRFSGTAPPLSVVFPLGPVFYQKFRARMGPPGTTSSTSVDPLASPVFFVFIAPPAQSASLVAEIVPRRLPQTSVLSDLLPWPAAEPRDRGLAGSGAADPHPGTTLVDADGRPRRGSESQAPPVPTIAAA